MQLIGKEGKMKILEEKKDCLIVQDSEGKVACVKKVKEVAVEPKVQRKVYTKKELIDKTRSEQVKILNKLGVSKIPKYEKDRVDKIIELQ